MGIPRFQRWEVQAYQSFFYRDLPQAAIKKYQINLIIYDPIEEVNRQWIS
jgi:hypothetical protein